MPDPARNPDTPHTSFAGLGLDERLLASVRDLGYETPTPIQAATIPPLLAGRHVVGLAQTGTGKTAAFALPILARIDPTQKAPQALVLCPTRELALQVCEAFERYAAHLPGLHVLPVYGGQGYAVQLNALRRGVHIIVGTPGRIMDHLEKGTLDLGRLRYLVLDEADEMLNMGFAEDVETILAGTPEDKQTALFSATMPPPIRRIAARYLTDAAEITIAGATATVATTAQRYLLVSATRKLDALTRILEVERFEAMLIFARTKQETEELAERLRARGFAATALNGDVAQAQRERTIAQLRAGVLDIVVATDVAARGLDVERISHVVNYDIPTDTESYVHRIGRTGRAGRAGDAISFVTPRERYLLQAIEKATRQRLTPMDLPTIDDVNTTRLSKFDDAITAALESESVAFYRDVVTHYVREYDVPEVDVAAALAVVLQGDTPLLLEPEVERGPADTGSRTPARPGGGFARYRLAVGRRHRVQPRQIVGALANEGGLTRTEIGHIDIRVDHSLVDLPAELPAQVWEALRGTRISGKLIELSRDDIRGDERPAGRAKGGHRAGRPSHAARHDRHDRPDRRPGKGGGRATFRG